jgi:translation elongation factor EF-1beta
MLKFSKVALRISGTASLYGAMHALVTGMVVSAGMVVAPAAMANEQQGVYCPSTHNAEIDLVAKNLKCKTKQPVEYTLQSICSPLAFSIKGIKINSSVVMQESGSDSCQAIGVGKTVPSLMQPPLPGYPSADKFTRTVSQGGVDVFVARVYEYAFPEGANYLVGDKSKGVTCESRFIAAKVFEDRGMVCGIYTESQVADCDFGWRHLPDSSGNTDICGATLPGTSDGPTKPRGMTKIQLDAINLLGSVEWKHFPRPGPDLWKKGEYAFPRHNN